jgi:diguanylate cyclase (GGDEF)-like protein
MQEIVENGSRREYNAGGLPLTYDSTQQVVSTWFGYAGNKDGISHVNIPAVLAMGDQTVWLSLGDGGVDIVSPLHGRIAQIRPDASTPRTALPKGRVLAMASSASGDVWLGTQQGLYRAESPGRRLTRVDIPGRKASAATWALYVDGDLLWLGGLDGLWGIRLPKEGGAVQVVARQDGHRLGDQRVTSLFPAPGHTLWVGTRAGLARFDPQSGVLEQMPQETPGQVGLPSGYITSVLTDRRGRLWVASFGGGVRVVEPRRQGAPRIVRRVGTKEGLPNNSVNAILFDDQENVWVSTDDGLACIHGDDLSVTTLRGADGVGVPTYWTNSAARTPSGALLFGGTSGLTIINPSQSSAWHFKAPLVVTEIDGGGGPKMGTKWEGTKPASLTLAPEKRSLLVEFAALDYSAPEANRYEYRLVGFDEDWTPTPASRRLARYTNLPPGDYVLELHGSNRQGAWSQPLRWAVHAPPAWYESNPFRAAMAVFMVISIAALIQARTLVLRRREKSLQRVVALRTEELENRTAELRESEHRLAEMAYFDGLTGLGNRRLFNDEVKSFLAQAGRGVPFSLLLIDLDNFKQINDTYGHDAGDALLKAAATRLRGAVRDVDRLARLGGDEFAVLLAGNVDRSTVDLVCERITSALSQPMEHAGNELRTSASIGVIAAKDADTSAEQLYKAADLALYEAKRAGRNGWRWSQAGPAAD